MRGAQQVLQETSRSSEAVPSDAVQESASVAAGPPPVMRTSVSLPDKSVTGTASEAIAVRAAGSPPVIRTSVSLPDKSVTGITSEAAASEAATSDAPKISKVTQNPIPPPATSDVIDRKSTV